MLIMVLFLDFSLVMFLMFLAGVALAYLFPNNQ